MGAFGAMTGEEIMTAWSLISLLVGAESNSVTIFAPNADFGAPPHGVAVSGHWTGYEDENFYGDSIIECLDAANRARVSRGG